jgi:hypothetical protein
LRRPEFITVDPYPLITRPPPFGGLRFRAGACRLALIADFRRLPPKPARICLALSFRLLLAMLLLLFRRAGFCMWVSTTE